MTTFWYYHQGSVAVGAVGVGVGETDVSLVVVGADASLVVVGAGASLVVSGAGASLVAAGADASLVVSVGVSLGAAVVAGSW